MNDEDENGWHDPNTTDIDDDDDDEEEEIGYNSLWRGDLPIIDLDTSEEEEKARERICGVVAVNALA